MTVSYLATSDRRRASSDRRAARRVPLVAGARVLSPGGLELGQARDLAPTGMSLVRAGAAHRPATPLRVGFALPDGEWVELDTEVVFDREDGGFRQTGVRFARVSDELRARLREFFDGCR